MTRNSRSLGELDAVERLVAQQAIRDALHRYCRAVDRGDWGLLRSVYHSDAVDDHGSYKGAVPGLVDWLADRFEHVGDSTHFLGQVLVEFTDPDTALVETYFLSRRLQPPSHQVVDGSDEDGMVSREVWGRYVDDFERRQGRWGIAKRLVVVDASYVSPVVNARRRADASVTWGLRNDRDPVILRSSSSDSNGRS